MIFSLMIQGRIPRFFLKQLMEVSGYASLQKAWAKIHGTYQRTVNGNIGDAYLILTGAPAHVLDID